MDQTPPLNNTAPTPTIAPTSPIPPDSYESRLASYTSWPHTRPGISDMAKAGFHRVPEPKWDGTECSSAVFSLTIGRNTTILFMNICYVRLNVLSSAISTILFMNIYYVHLNVLSSAIYKHKRKPHQILRQHYRSAVSRGQHLRN